MSAEVETMAYAGETPWHGLGVPVDNRLTPHEMLVAAGCDWSVEKHDTMIKIGKDTIYTGNKALVRTSDNKILSPNLGPKWEPVQNSQAFEFFDKFVKAGHMTMETAGSLRGGQIVWALAKVGESFEVFKGDTVESYLLFSNPHIYGKSTVVDYTAIRTVCMNTLMMALDSKSKNAAVLNHRSKFDPAKVEEILGLASNNLSKYKESAEFLGSVKADEDEIIEFFNRVWPIKVAKGAEAKKSISKLAKVALDNLHTQPGAKFAEGTWWQPYNAITFMVDHLICREHDHRLSEAWFGQTKKTKLDAYNLAIEYAKKAA